jgi:Ca2+-binding EF-hand superfamily protein
MCYAKFDALDVDRNGVLSPIEVFPVIQELSLEKPVAVTAEHCVRFVEMFDQAGTGVLSRSEFSDFIKFVWFMRWLESQAEAPMAEESELVPEDEAAVRIDDMLDMMHNDRKELKKQVGRLSCSPVVPDFIQKTFQDEEFIASVLQKFDVLDVDRNGFLSPSEVFPVIVELSMEQPMSITYDHCTRFVEMFDQDKKGVLSKGEFCDFVKFVWFMRWLESQDEQSLEVIGAEQAAAAQADEDSQVLNYMLEMLHSDHKELKRQFGKLSSSPSVPDFIRNALNDEGFAKMCDQKFAKLDHDKNRVLTPNEVFPVVVELSRVQPVSISYEHCARFVRIFDLDGKGVLNKSEFREFVALCGSCAGLSLKKSRLSRLWIMRWLKEKRILIRCLT